MKSMILFAGAAPARIALTGGIACGKSLVARMLNRLGVATLDADDVVHELLPDPAERRRIAAEVFADPARRRTLEARLHPIVKARLDAFLSSHASARSSLITHHSSLPPPPSLALVIVPLLFETHWDENYDIICCVASERETQIARMTATRGYSRAEAEARLAAQLPVAEKAAKSHYVIHNDGSVEDLQRQTERFVSWLKNSTSSRTR